MKNKVDLGLGITCIPYTEKQLSLAYIKRCPHCKSNNDLVSWLKLTASLSQAQTIIIPLCIMCERPLWKLGKRMLGWIAAKTGLRECGKRSY
jgi:hypothetical protein